MKVGVIAMFRKAALKIGIPTLFAFMTWNGYLAVNHLTQMHKIAALTLESSIIQIDLSSVLQDLTDMETGQRGFLLTDDPSYLQPYSDAKDRIAIDFAGLHMGLASRTEHERSLLTQLESLAKSKQAEMERSINLRQQGYRHRAFMLVDSNEGMEYMDRARAFLSSLSVAENSNFARLDRKRNATLSKALAETLVGNLCLAILTACLFGLFGYHAQILEQEAGKSRKELAMRDLQLEKLTSALSSQALSKTSAIETNARLLLQNYGGFLPRRGHEYAEQIKEASAQMERLRQDLVSSLGFSNEEQSSFDSAA